MKNIYDQIRFNVCINGHVSTQVWDQVGNRIRDPVWRQVGDQVRDPNLSQFKALIMRRSL